MPYVSGKPQQLPMKDGKVDYKAIKRAVKQREEAKVRSKSHQVKLTLFDAAVCLWRHANLNEPYSMLEAEYGVSKSTMQKQTRKVKEMGGLSIVPRGEMADLFPDGPDGQKHSDSLEELFPPVTEE